MKIIGKKIFIFDYDGTIADTSKIHEESFHKVLDPLDIKFHYKDLAGLKTKDAITESILKNKKKFNQEDIDLFVKKKQEIFRNLIEKKINSIPGAREFIKWAYKKYHLSIASSGSKDNVLKGINLLGLRDYFTEIICSEDVINAKPDPEIFKKVLSITKFSVDACLVFEDSDNGILAAKNANLDYIDVRKNSFKYLLFYFKENAS